MANLRHVAGLVAAGVGIAAIGCSRPLEAWVQELQSDEPFTKRLAAAALGAVTRTQEEAHIAAHALFQAYDPGDAALAATIFTSLDDLGTSALALARSTLRTTTDSPDAEHQRKLVQAWLLTSKLPLDAWLRQEATFAAHPHWQTLTRLLRHHRVVLDASALTQAPPGLHTLCLLEKWAGQPDPTGAGATLAALTTLVALPQGLEAAIDFFTAPADRVRHLHASLAATSPIATPWHRVLTAVLFRHLDSGATPVADIFAYLDSPSAELEAALVANTALADERLAELACAALAHTRAESPAAVTTLETLATDDARPRVRDAARSALERRKK